jgi:hypothetical protein
MHNFAHSKYELKLFEILNEKPGPEISRLGTFKHLLATNTKGNKEMWNKKMIYK